MDADLFPGKHNCGTVSKVTQQHTSGFKVLMQNKVTTEQSNLGHAKSGKLITTLRSLIFWITLTFPNTHRRVWLRSTLWHQKEEEKEDRYFPVLSWIFFLIKKEKIYLFLIKKKFHSCKILEWNVIFMGKLPRKNCLLNKNTCDFMHIISEIFRFSKVHISKRVVVWRVSQ